MIAKKIVFLLLVATLAVSNNIGNGNGNVCERMNFLPMPDELTCGDKNAILNDPCKILYHVKI